MKSTYLISDFLELESLSMTSPTQLLLSAPPPPAAAALPSTSSSEFSALLLLAVRFLFGYLEWTAECGKSFEQPDTKVLL